VRRVTLTVTTDGDGDGSAQSPQLNGLLRRIAYEKVDFADGVDVDIADHLGTVLLDVDDVNADAAWHPRQPTHSTAGVASLYAAAEEPVESDFPIDGPITVTVAAGGDTTSGLFHIWVG
jgi:hypothetical protein